MTTKLTQIENKIKLTEALDRALAQGEQASKEKVGDLKDRLAEITKQEIRQDAGNDSLKDAVIADKTGDFDDLASEEPDWKSCLDGNGAPICSL